jgi:hypothetical protein
MRPLNLISVTAIFFVAAFAPASAGPELPMYQFPQANQMPMLPQPTLRPRDVACTPVTPPAPQGGTIVANADVSSKEAAYHVVEGKCVPVGGKQ